MNTVLSSAMSRCLQKAFARHVAGGYDNSYVVADPNEAWVVETIGWRWFARRIGEDVTPILNTPSIRA